ncbi:MAG: bifunctional phosphopantothenoylcysteine decarboxylase/phosphopantothenate--cysteine ligase CoaBC [Vicinamibacteria bacterium]|nr:bifunctional phosphopantothenoylcysteine decarboxylase/phosphopantothenate--cysteine ligase CoaBC [Vicinamibacteria bacterium]
MASILLGVTGGIAAYKACEVLRLFDKAGHRVRVVMTRMATEFVGPLTFETLSKGAVLTDAQPLGENGSILHIDYADQADIFVIAPCTANVIAKLAQGMADDALSTTALAFTGPVLIAPAMNVNMWNSASVRENLDILRTRGVHVVEPSSGDLACGWVGEGRLAEPAEVVSAALKVLDPYKDLARLRVLVSAGPTQEKIDPVRYIANRSSGKMGYALAEAARDRGASVTLVSGPVALSKPDGVSVVNVESATQMKRAMEEALDNADVVIMSAAVADYRVETAAEHKIKKGRETMQISLVRNDDILAALGQSKRADQVLIGFAAETHDVVAYGQDKLKRKKADLFVANDVSRPDIGFSSDENEVHLLFADGRVVKIDKAPKRRIADAILDAAKELHRLNAAAKLSA